ncbi:Pyridine nucleotide-disulfide oxidoreductase domain-containing protein 1 [Sarcoptes scabiei]|uniref:Pyridine nucleotide-disulfide oxidoreductase domain-containing protein 1 n=1 Tax=Sarcoptes scabiei TaxID=52283 RepID=A0A834R859_SARSC|nr:Pyridine nucleotide-disulfide oxidoreductase domain-containing protein 1 [Sarcoptes scabiei]UXI17917.1 Vinculin [Sarcoptes scabiei]
MKPIIIVGGGIAGVTCAKILHLDCQNLDVILISASPLVKTIANLKTFGRSIDVFDVAEQNLDDLQQSNLKVRLNKVIALDSEQHRIQLDDGEWLPYSKLCLCTGAKPQRIPLECFQSIEKYIRYIRDTMTANDFHKMLQKSKKIVVTGNGGIALEAVYAIDNVEVVWLIKSDSIGSVWLDAGASKFFSDFLHKNSQSNSKTVSKRARYEQDPKHSKQSYDEMGVALGPDWYRGLELKGKTQEKKVSLEKNVEIVMIYSKLESIPISKRSSQADLSEKDPWNVYIELNNGKIIGCDMILVGYGVVPNNQVFLPGNDFKLASDQGIIVDHEMRTSLVDVYAAGDVCSAVWDPNKTPYWFQMRTWTQARQMGYYAAKCIQSHLQSTDPEIYFNFEVFTHVTNFFGFRSTFLGLFNGQKLLDDQYKILCSVTPGKEYRKVILKDDRMKGAILIGNENLEETFEFLIYNQTDLSRFGDLLLEDIVDIEDFFD